MTATICTLHEYTFNGYEEIRGARREWSAHVDRSADALQWCQNHGMQPAFEAIDQNGTAYTVHRSARFICAIPHA